MEVNSNTKKRNVHSCFIKSNNREHLNGEQSSLHIISLVKYNYYLSAITPSLYFGKNRDLTTCINRLNCLTIYNVKTKFYNHLGGIKMTVGSQVKQAIAGLKSVQASFEQFALQTENQQAKQLYTNAAEQTKQVLQQVEPRISEIEQEEPQYKQM